MFKKAERKQTKLKLAITGPTGSGKTFSALRLAHGLGGRVAVIDTENGSASLYSDMKEGPLVGFEFDVLDMTPPFTTEKYIDAINAAEKAGYETIVIDSLTHAWAGEGGLLEQKNLLDSRPNSNHWTNWAPIDKKDSALKNAFLHSSCHIIATMRSKMEYAQTQVGEKKKIEKLGLAPIQRDGLVYDFSIVFDVSMDHNAEVSKDRTNLFDGKIFKITEETGELISSWLKSGKEVKKEVLKNGYNIHVDLSKVIEKPEDYVYTFDTPHKNKKLKEISVDVIQKNIDYWIKVADENRQSLKGHQSEFVSNASVYLKQLSSEKELNQKLGVS
jgi:hypothetical protein